MVVSGGQVDDHVEQVVLTRRQQRLSEVTTFALVLLRAQEVLQAVGDSLHLLHLRVVHSAKVEDPPVGWRDLMESRKQE